MFQQPFSGLIYVLQFEPADWSNSSKMGAQQRHGRIEVIFGLLLLILKTHLSRPSTLMKKSFTRLYTVMTSCFTLFSAACLRLTHPPQQHFKKTWSTTHQLRTRHQSAAQAFGGWRKLLTCEASYQVKVSKCFQRHWKKKARSSRTKRRRIMLSPQFSSSPGSFHHSPTQFSSATEPFPTPAIEKTTWIHTLVDTKRLFDPLFLLIDCSIIILQVRMEGPAALIGTGRINAGKGSCVVAAIHESITASQSMAQAIPRERAWYDLHL